MAPTSSISGRMTAALIGYSSVFMRYSMMVTPKNYLLFGMHFVNFGAQNTQAYRFINYHYMGGKDKVAEEKAKEGLGKAENAAQDAATKVQEGAKDVADEAKKQVEKVTR